MSNTSFRVDLAELGALSDALVRAEHAVRNAAGALDAPDSADPAADPAVGSAAGSAIGTADLDRACAQLLGDWSAGLGELGRQLEQAADDVSTAARNYSGTESRLAAALRSTPPAAPAAPEEHR